uniref:Shugoshin_C domain-containing protein n=1 Tax=Elaeophora elaphi TaxID=1147741 RepID=A0A0R3RG78_9BILA
RSATQHRKRKSKCSEETREGVAKNQSRQEEPSTLVGIASIDRDDAPSAISQLRSNVSVNKISLLPKRRILSKNTHTKRRFVK